MKVMLTGAIGIGKSTLAGRVARAWPGPVEGLQSKKVVTGTETADVRLYPWGKPEAACTVAQFAPGHRALYPDVFDRAGVAFLQAMTRPPGGLFAIDELGFIESQALLFQRAVFQRLEQPGPALLVLRLQQTPFLDALRAMPRAAVFVVTAENRDRLLPQICSLLGMPTQKGEFE